MKTYETVLDPLTKSTIRIKLFRKVKNVPELRKQIVSGKLRCCVIKPTLILDPFQIVVAANKALVAEKQQHLITRSVFSEILFNLSISKNVSKSLPLFGIDDKFSDILVAVVSNENFNEIFAVIDGEEHDLEELKYIADLKTIKKVYNITPDEEKYSELLDLVVNKIVIKDF